jgi:hypothetical protein
MDHHAEAVELLAHGEPTCCDIEFGDADQNLLLLAALTHAVLALTDAVECTRGEQAA